MRINTKATYGLELGAGAAALCLFVTGSLLGGFEGVDARSALGAFSIAASLVAAGVGVGAALRHREALSALSDRDATISELQLRPTHEELDRLRLEHRETLEALSSAEAELVSLSEERAQAATCCTQLGEELSRARVTAALDHFSAFQLLNMCDVCDAEDEFGYLERELNDPGMEQLSALGVVLFSHTQDGGATLKWTLTPQWRATVHANRALIDARTQELRERRTDDVAGIR